MLGKHLGASWRVADPSWSYQIRLACEVTSVCLIKFNAHLYRYMYLALQHIVSVSLTFPWDLAFDLVESKMSLHFLLVS